VNGEVKRMMNQQCFSVFEAFSFLLDDGLVLILTFSPLGGVSG
jgi:hypothetical protein